MLALEGKARNIGKCIQNGQRYHRQRHGELHTQLQRNEARKRCPMYGSDGKANGIPCSGLQPMVWLKVRKTSVVNQSSGSAHPRWLRRRLPPVPSAHTGRASGAPMDQSTAFSRPGQRVSAAVLDQVPAGAAGGAQADGRRKAREDRRRGDRVGGKSEFGE